ncbi:MAG TPA: hypothetical protein DE060_06960, partial [Lentisphaeria bacterium]|nr:hypothetical protein [Lentisphaeria bacterium]
ETSRQDACSENYHQDRLEKTHCCNVGRKCKANGMNRKTAFGSIIFFMSETQLRCLSCIGIRIDFCRDVFEIFLWESPLMEKRSSIITENSLH